MVHCTNVLIEQFLQGNDPLRLLLNEETEILKEVELCDSATFIGTAGGSLGLFIGFSFTGFADQILDFFIRNWFVSSLMFQQLLMLGISFVNLMIR